MQYKGREIESPLSDDDRAFLLSRGKDVLVAQFDQQEKAAVERARLLAELGVDELGDEKSSDFKQWNNDELRAEIAERKQAALDSDDDERAIKLTGKGNKSALLKQLADDDALLDESE